MSNSPVHTPNYLYLKGAAISTLNLCRFNVSFLQGSSQSDVSCFIYKQTIVAIFPSIPERFSSQIELLSDISHALIKDELIVAIPKSKFGIDI
jgi:hypothetical protein